MPHPTLRYLVIAALSLATSAAASAQSIDRIEPPVARRGQTTRITFVGADLAQAVDVWSSLSAGQWRATPVGASTKDRATFDVTVAADAPVGMCGLRVATRDGLSNAHLFLIDDLPTLPRQANAEPQPVKLPAAVWGSFREAGVERFTIDVQAGQRVSFEVVGNRLGKDADPLITLRDGHGKFIAERDNDVGLCFDCRFEHVFATAGTHIVEVRDARFQPAEHAAYVLRMGRFPAARSALPAAVKPGQRNDLTLPEAGGPAIALEIPADQRPGPLVASLRRPEDEGSTWTTLLATTNEATVAQPPCAAPDQATPAKLPGVLCGVLKEPGSRQFFRLDLEKGQKLRVRGEARSLHSPADLELAITDAKGTELRRASNPGLDEVTFDYNAGNAGPYFLAVRDLNRDGGPAFVYRVEVQAPKPTFTVIADVEGLTIPQNGYQSLPLAVTRSENIGPIKLKLLGAPAGVSITPDEIGESNLPVLARLSAAPDTPLGLYAVQIVAEVDGLAPVLVRTVPLIDRRRVNVDLIPYALREDQTRLPPPLTDRLAVQVTPPAPFTLELPERLVTLARYQHVEFPIVTTRQAGFDGPITFTARGGQLADKEEGRTRVYAELPAAAAAQAEVKGSIHSRILANLGRTRIELEGRGTHQGRRVTLTRSFELDLRPAFRINAQVMPSVLAPGESTKLVLEAQRVKSFAGPIRVQLAPVNGIDLPADLEIPRGQDRFEIEVKVPASWTPGRINFRARCAAQVGEFEEEINEQLQFVDVRKPEVKK